MQTRTTLLACGGLHLCGDCYPAQIATTSRCIVPPLHHMYRCQHHMHVEVPRMLYAGRVPLAALLDPSMVCLVVLSSSAFVGISWNRSSGPDKQSLLPSSDDKRQPSSYQPMFAPLCPNKLQERKGLHRSESTSRASHPARAVMPCQSPGALSLRHYCLLLG